ncbi:MAG TPA: response regulator, partial [Nitrospirota bacterium]
MSEKILVIDDERSICDAIAHILKGAGYAVTTSTSGSEGLKIFEGGRFDLVITDMKMEGINGLDVLRRVNELDPEVPVMVITAFGSIDSAVEAVKLGATDYIAKPFVNDDLKLRVNKTLEAIRLTRENQELRAQLSDRYDFSNILGRSEVMKKSLRLLDRAIPTNSTILITGETGTGKGLVAKTVHYNSLRKGKPFVAVNCGAIPD